MVHQTTRSRDRLLQECRSRTEYHRETVRYVRVSQTQALLVREHTLPAGSVFSCHGGLAEEPGCTGAPSASSGGRQSQNVCTGAAMRSRHLGSNGRWTALLSKDSKMAQIVVAKQDGIYTSGYRHRPPAVQQPFDLYAGLEHRFCSRGPRR